MFCEKNLPGLTHFSTHVNAGQYMYVLSLNRKLGSELTTVQHIRVQGCSSTVRIYYIRTEKDMFFVVILWAIVILSHIKQQVQPSTSLKYALEGMHRAPWVLCVVKLISKISGSPDIGSGNICNVHFGDW